MILTFSLVLFLTMLKEAYEDYQKYKSDRDLNNRVTRIYDRENNSTKECLWRDVKVGQIVRVNKDEEIPADLVCIAAPKDVVYVSTMNLDGETNLKERTLPFAEVTLESLS